MKRFLIMSSAALLLCGCGMLGGIGGQGSGKAYTFKSLPTSVEELKALPDVSLKDPYAVAAMTVAALTSYESNQKACMEMLNYLKGPEEMSKLAQQQLADRLRGKSYKVMSFFDGATPDNNYTPSKPYTVRVSSNSYSFQESGWATLYVTSGGADSPRPVKLRQKQSTGEWFLNDIQFLGDIRTPASADPWR
ncbi:MAG: hypothetical protein J5520_07165 [Bacteroidales bacterium]|nr:hypothetical protein [Bacteroidales bacterium]MBR4771472.1 hypothetical protein [Bacteroidales bacterium]